VYRKFPGGIERPGRDADLSPPSSAVGHERVELYLYSSYGPYGLYRALVSVQGCTLPYSITIPLLPLRAARPVQSLSACTRVHFTFTFFHKLASIASQKAAPWLLSLIKTSLWLGNAIRVSTLHTSWVVTVQFIRKFYVKKSDWFFAMCWLLCKNSGHSIHARLLQHEFFLEFLERKWKKNYGDSKWRTETRQLGKSEILLIPKLPSSNHVFSSGNRWLTFTITRL